MNRQALIAAVTTVIALAGAGSAFAVEATQDDARPVSSANRADVRNGAHAGLSQGEASVAPTPSSSLTRVQVAAEAREAVRLGLAFSNEAGSPVATPEQQDSIRLAGLRAIGGTAVAGVSR
jgi:hypothetical protein